MRNDAGSWRSGWIVPPKFPPIAMVRIRKNGWSKTHSEPSGRFSGVDDDVAADRLATGVPGAVDGPERLVRLAVVTLDVLHDVDLGGSSRHGQCEPDGLVELVRGVLRQDDRERLGRVTRREGQRAVVRVQSRPSMAAPSSDLVRAPLSTVA